MRENISIIRFKITSNNKCNDMWDNERLRQVKKKELFIKVFPFFKVFLLEYLAKDLITSILIWITAFYLPEFRVLLNSKVKECLNSLEIFVFEIAGRPWFALLVVLKRCWLRLLSIFILFFCFIFLLWLVFRSYVFIHLQAIYHDFILSGFWDIRKEHS